MKYIIILLTFSAVTAACGLLGLRFDYNGGHARLEKYDTDLNAITAQADSSSAVVDSALWRTKGYVQVVSIEAQFQTEAVNTLVRKRKNSAPIR